MIRIKIKGMTCNHCVMAVTRALEEIDAVRKVRVDLGKKEAVFDETGPVDMEMVREKIRKAGYEVES